jgi:XTP/dITP diphosphohydrolase
VSAPDSGSTARTAPQLVRLLLASSNSDKLREFRDMASENEPQVRAVLEARAERSSPIQLDLLPNFSELPAFDESAPTFAENAAGKALYYSRYSDLPILADDSGLVVDALGGAPGVRSARYAGTGATDADRIVKLLRELRRTASSNRRARFVCVLALARSGQALGVFSDAAEGEIAESPRGAGGFGYDPVFLFPALGKTFAEIPGEAKNLCSHRGKAFRKLLAYLAFDALPST